MSCIQEITGNYTKDTNIEDMTEKEKKAYINWVIEQKHNNTPINPNKPKIKHSKPQIKGFGHRMVWSGR